METKFHKTRRFLCMFGLWVLASGSCGGIHFELVGQDFVLAMNPSGYWPADEGSGEILNDRSGNGKHGRLLHVPWKNGMLEFTSAYQWAELPGIVQGSSFSFGGWLFTRRADYVAGGDQADGMVFLGNSALGIPWPPGALGSGISIGAVGGGLAVAVRSGGTKDVLGSMSGGGGLESGTWQHLMYTFDAGTGRLYVNGQLVKEKSGVPFNPAAQNRAFFVGADATWWMVHPPPARSLDGSVKSLVLFNRALTAEEVSKLCAVTRPQTFPSLYPTDSVRLDAKTIPLQELSLCSVEERRRVLEVLTGWSASALVAKEDILLPVLEQALDEWETRAVAARLLVKLNTTGALEMIPAAVPRFIQTVGDDSASREERFSAALALAGMGAHATGQDGTESGEIVFKELFLDPPGTALSSTTAGDGWSSGWMGNNGLTSVLDGTYTTIDGSLTSAAFTSRRLSASGGRFEINALNSVSLWRGLATPVDWSANSTLYFSALVHWGGNHASTASHLYFTLGDSNTRFGFTADGVTPHKMRLNVRNTTSSDQYGAVLYDAGPTYLLVAKIETRSTGVDTLYLSLFEPNEVLPETEPVSWDLAAGFTRSGVSDVFGFDARFYLSHSVSFDEFRAGTTFFSVTSQTNVDTLIAELDLILVSEGLRVPRVEDLLRNSLIRALLDIDRNAEGVAEILARTLPNGDGGNYFSQGDVYRDGRAATGNARAYTPAAVRDDMHYQIGAAIPFDSADPVSAAALQQAVAELSVDYPKAGSWRASETNLYRVKIIKTGPDGQSEEAFLEGGWFIFDGTDAKLRGWSVAVDNEGYLHLVGGQHNAPNAANYIPGSWERIGLSRSSGAPDFPRQMYWVSEYPGDIASFKFAGQKNNPRAIPIDYFNYMNFVQDQNGELYVYGRAARSGWQSWGLYRYDLQARSWSTSGGDAFDLMSSADQNDPGWRSYLIRNIRGSVPAEPGVPVLAWAWQPHFYNYCRASWGIQFDRTNRMHVRVPIRGLDAEARLIDRDLYAWSDDGGARYFRADGSPVVLPLTLNPAPGHNADSTASSQIGWDLWLSLLKDAGYTVH